MINSLVAGRNIARRIILLQVVSAAVLGAMFLVIGSRDAVAAMASGLLVAAGSAVSSVRYFGSVGGAGLVLGRLFMGMILKWAVIVGGLIMVMFHYKLPPLAAVTGLVAAYAVYLLAFRFKG
jgi:hypothetical protein